MQKDLISVVVPCYNASSYIQDCFDSVDSQTYKNFEVIFVNDGSQDNTLQLLNEYCASHHNSVVVNQPNLGPSMARNAGLNKATGEYVYFYDSDDILSQYMLEILHTNIIKYKADISVVRYKRVGEHYHMERTKKHRPTNNVQEYDQQGTLLKVFRCGLLLEVSVWNKLYKHIILKQIKTYPNVFNPQIKCGEDIEFNYKYLKYSKKGVFSDAVCYCYRQHKSSIVHNGFNEEKLTDFIGLNYVERDCHQNFPEVELYIKGWKSSVCVAMLWSIFLSDYDDKDKITRLFDNFKDNLACIPLGKNNSKLLRVVTPCAYPLLKLGLAKRLHFKE